MCHMWSDSPAELHAMADHIGLARKWFQQPPKASWEHYDVSLSLKAKALAAGAVLTDKYEPLVHTRRLQLLRSHDPMEIARCVDWLITVENFRNRG